MNKLDECIRGYVWPKSKLEGQGESVEAGSETSTDVSAGLRLRGARGIYYPRGPFAADLQHLPLQRVQEKQWGQNKIK